MRYKFSLEHNYVPTWNGNKDLPEGEQIKVKIKPFEFGDTLLLLDALTQIGVADADGKVDTDKMDAKSIKPLIEQFGALLPKAATVINLKDDAGGDIDIGTVVRFGAFFGLAAEILMYGVSISAPNESDTKNSKPPAA